MKILCKAIYRAAVKLRSNIRLCSNLWTSSAPPRCSACSIQNHARYFVSICENVLCNKNVNKVYYGLPKICLLPLAFTFFFLLRYLDEQLRNWRNTRPMLWLNFELCILKSGEDNVDFSISSQCGSIGMTYSLKVWKNALCHSSF